ncbi:DUF6745 domain-containing protein [Micromonospora costi]|nr:hypothetical protein [Micromonospora costi]
MTGNYRMRPVWFWDDEDGFVDQDDEAHAVVRYILRHDDRFFEPAWTYYPDWLMLAAIDTYHAITAAAPDPAWEACREVALTTGPWWPFADVAVVAERSTSAAVDSCGLLLADDHPVEC